MDVGAILPHLVSVARRTGAGEVDAVAVTLDGGGLPASAGTGVVVVSDTHGCVVGAGEIDASG